VLFRIKESKYFFHIFSKILTISAHIS